MGKVSGLREHQRELGFSELGLEKVMAALGASTSPGAVSCE